MAARGSPERTSALLARARALCLRGNLEAAAAVLVAAADAEPGDIEVRVALGEVWCGLADFPAALECFVRVLDAEGRHMAALQGLARCLAARPELGLALASADHLITGLYADGVDPDHVAQGCFVRLRHAPDPVADPLLLAVLSQALVTDELLEGTLTRARRQLCLHPPGTAPALALALAEQGRRNEYAWAVDEAEQRALPSAPPWVRAMYQAGAPDEWPDGRMIAEAPRIPALTRVVEGGSTEVRAQYEEHPYPQWDRFTRRAPYDLGDALRRLNGDAFQPSAALQRPDLFVAGCGTGRELLIAASAWQPSTVTAIDLSGTSLAYAQGKSEQLGIRVELLQGDILELAGWDRRFDVIVCTGVLHHLTEPMTGWRALRGLLRPGGVMLVGLYSDTARAGIAAAQELVREAGLGPTPDGLRAARTLVRSLPAGHPACDCLALRDFYYLSGCRDLLLHVQEQRYTVQAIRDALADLDLEFLAFDVDPEVMGRYRTLFGSRMDLGYWEALERLHPRMFLGMYQFWCQSPPQA